MTLWYSYDLEVGYETWPSAAEAEAHAEACLEYHRDRSPDGWHEGVRDIEWGMLLPFAEARQVNVVATPEGEHDYICDYELCAVHDAKNAALVELGQACTKAIEERNEAREELAAVMEALEKLRARAEWAEGQVAKAQDFMDNLPEDAYRPVGVTSVEAVIHRLDLAQKRILELTQEAQEIREECQALMAAADRNHDELRRTQKTLEVTTRERDEALKQVESLKQELEVAQAFHDVAVKERDAAGAEVDWLRGQLARLRAWATGEKGEPTL